MTAAMLAETDARWDALVVHPDDDVAVALHDLKAGATINARREGSLVHVRVTQPIPLGHKVALHALAQATPIRKYGECIGVATTDIAAGAHVHVHNLASARARKST